jgi:hypothetical protein
MGKALSIQEVNLPLYFTYGCILWSSLDEERDRSGRFDRFDRFGRFGRWGLADMRPLLAR